MEKILFQAPAVIQGVRTLVDGGVKLDVVTQEVSPDEMTKLFSLKGKMGWFLMSPNNIQLGDVPKENVKEITGKTPSQRLRAIAFVFWQECTSQQISFEVFYAQEMEKIINAWKERLPEK